MKRAAGAVAAAYMVLNAGIASAAPTDLYYERSLISAAGARCGFFSPQLLSALKAGAQQARGVALRAGVSNRDLDATAARAVARARSEPCDSKDLKMVADRAREAFEGYERLQRMRYAGEVMDWQASRHRSESGRVWNLSQQVSVGQGVRDRLTFGLTAKGNEVELIGVVRFQDGARPYAARLVMRDPSRAGQPYLDTRVPKVNGQLPLRARVTPRSATTTYFAQARFEPDSLIREVGNAPSTAYRFPIAAADAMARLDPREAVEVEFLFNGATGDTVRRAYVEVGDFAAGRAFMWVHQP